MSSRKSKKSQKLGSSRRYRNRNREIEEKEDGEDGNEEHDSEQSQFQTVSENQASNESSLLHSDQPVIACTNPNTSVSELSPQPQSQDFKDLLAQAEETHKKRKMGSTRKSNRNFKFEGIYEDEAEHRVQLGEGVSDKQGVTVEASIKEDGGKEDQTSLLDCAPSQASEHERSILGGKHLAPGTIMHNEDDHKNDEHQHVEAALQSKSMDISSSELNQSKEAEFSQDLVCTSLDFCIVTPAECNVPLQELGESLQTYHQMDTFSDPVASLPNTTGQKSKIDTTYTPLNGNRVERQDVQMSLNSLIHNDKPSMAKTMDDQSSLNVIIRDKQEDKHEREDVNTLEGCSAEDIGQDEVTGVQSASLINEHEHGTPDDKVATVIWQNVNTKASTEDENIVDHCLEHKDDTLKLTKERIYKSKSAEDIDEYKEVSVAGDRTDNDSDEGVAATNLNQAMQPDRNIISPLKLKDEEVGTSSDQFLSYEFKFQCDSEIKCYREEQYDVSEARCWTGESSAEEDIAKKDMVDMCYDVEEKYREIGTEREVENDGMQATTSNQLFSKVSSTNMLDFVTESELIPAETLYGETATSSQTCNLQHNNPGEFPTELEMQSEEGVCSDQVLDEVINDRSEFLDIESEVIEEENNDIKEEINAGSTKDFTKEDFIRVNDEKDGMSTFMNERETASVITNIQDYAFTDQASMVVEEHSIGSPDKGSGSPVHAYPTSDPMEIIPETQVKLDMQVYNAIGLPDQKQNMSEECLVNPTNTESEAEQFESTSRIVYIQDSRQGQDDAVAENVRFSPSEKKQIDSTQRSLSGLISGGDQKDSFKTMKETMQVQSSEESTPMSEDGTLSLSPETCYPQSSESLNIMEPEEEKMDENVIKAVVKNENTYTSQEYNETRQRISTEVVNTNQECSVLDRQGEETVVVKNICRGLDTTHVVLSDVVDTEVLNMQSITEVVESTARNEEAVWEGDKDGQRISLENLHQNTYPDLKLGLSKSSECTEFVTDTINTDHLITSAEPMDAAEIAQLSEENILQATTTAFHEEACMLISKDSHRRKMGSIHRTLGGKREEKDIDEDMYGEEKYMAFTDISTCSQQYMYSELSSQIFLSSQTTIEHSSAATEHGDFKEDDRNSVETVEKTNAEIHTQTQTKKKKKFGSTRRPHGRHQPHAEGEEGEWKDPETTEEIEHQIITQAATSNLLTEPQNTMSEVTLDIHDSPMTTEQKEIIKAEVEIMTEGIDASPAILSHEVDQIHTVVSDKVSNAEGLTDIIEQHERSGVNEENVAESTLLYEQEMEPVITKIQDDAFTEHVSLAVKKHGNGSPDNEHVASEVNVYNTCGPVEFVPETQAMSDMQMNTEHIHAVVSDQNQNISEEHLENPTNRESEAEQLESTSPFVQIQESKSSQLDVTKETLEFSSSEKRRKIGSTRKSLRGQIPRGDQENKLEAIKDKENIQEQNMDQEGTNTGEIEEENDDTKEEINAGTTENLIKEDITTVCAQQNVLCELSSQTTDLGLSAIEHPSPATEHPDFKQDDGNITENVENRNAEIHTQTQTKKKKKFGSTRRPHGRHQPHAEGEEGEWKDPENTEEIEHQIITQAATSNLLTEPQNTMSEVTLDIHDSPMTTEQKEIIKAEVEIVTEGIDASPAILSHEVDQIHTVVSDEVSNAEGLTDIIEQHERSGVNEENVAESTLLYEQEMEPVITKIQDDAFTEHVSLAVKKHGNGSPDNEHVASEVNVYNTCGPVELIPETQAMSDMQMNTEHIHAVVSDQNQNISEEHLENPTNRESEAEQLESTSPFVQIQESKSSQLDVTKETLEFSSSEKRRKIGSTRKSLRGQIPRGDQENKLEAIKDKENIQEQNMDQEGTNTGDIEEENDDTKEEINAGTTEILIKEDITTVCAQQNVLCELSSQTTDLGLSAIEHPSPATEHPDFKQDDGNITENVEKTNAEIHTQTQTKKKKKFGSTRRPHGRHQPHAEGEEGEWKDPENTEEIEHQIITQAATSNLLTEPQNTMSEVTLDIHDSPMTTEQKEIIKAEVEIVTEGIDASPAILSHEVDQIHTVVSDKVSNAEGLTDIIEQHERSGVNEENVAESTLLYEQEMEPVITKIQDDAFTEHVSLAVKKHGNGSPDNEHVASEVNVYNTCGPVELIPETQAMSDMQMNTEHIHAVVSDQNQNISEEHLENPTNRESEAEQLESTSPFVQIQESKSSQLDVTKETLEFNSSEKRRKIGSTRKSLRGQIHRGDQENKLEAIKDKENIQEQNMDQEGTNTGEIEEENDDTKEEINAGNTENFIKEDITTVSAEQNVLCELSSQTTDLGLSAIEHPSPATEHPDFKQDDGNITENVENRNAEIHTQTQTMKKKKFGSTRRPHGRHQPHAEGEEGEWKDPENTEEIEHQIITQAATSNLLTEPQNTMSEVTLDIHDSPMTTEQKEIIKAEVEIVTEGIDASPAILSHEVDQIHTVVSDEVSNAEGLTDIIEQHERSGVNEENVAESTLLYEQEMEPVITKIQDDAFTEHVSLAVKKHGNGSPDNEHVASEVNVYNTCGPVELIPETQAMSDMQMNTEHIHAVVSDQNQNISEEHLENPTNRESEAEQLESTSPFVQIQESKSSQLDVTKETLEFSSSEKRRKIGSTRKSLRGQIPRGDQENKLEAIKDKENIQEQNMDQEGTNTGDIEEENDDTKEEINAGTTEILIKEDITTVCAQQNVLCELSSQTTDLGLSAIEHPSPATEHPDFKQDDGNITENVEKTNAEIHTQTQTKKKKKFGSTRRPHGRHQPHAEGEEGEWKDPENTEEIEHQIITQAATSNLLTEPQNTMSEVTLDIHDSPMTTEQKEIIKAEVEIVTEGIDASPAILSHEVDQIHTVVSDKVSNAEGLTDIIEQHERSGVNEENVAESTLLYEQEMEPVITKIQDDAFTEHVSLAVKKHGNGSPDNEHVASEVNVYNTCGPVELIPETQAMSDMQMNTEHIHAVVSDQNQNISEEHLENPTNRESEAEQLESTSPFVQIQESKSSQLDVTKETLEFNSSEKRRKIGSTRKSLRGQIHRGDQENKLEAIKDKENIQEQNMDQEGTNTGEIEEENDDTKEEINAGNTENFIKEDITTVSAEQNVLCELSSQTTDLGLSAIEHPSPATEHPDFKQDDGNITENVENRNAEIHTQTQTMKKKKFGSTRRPHGRHQPHAEGEEGEWKDPENTEEIEHQIITQAATSNLLTEPQNTMSEVTLDIHDSPMTTEQKEIIKAEVEIVTEGIDASPAILSHEVDQIHTVVSDKVSNAEGLTDIIEQHERSGVNEENVAESTLLYEQEMEPVITKIQDDAFTEHVSLAVKKHGNGSPDNEHVASEVNVYNTCGPVELIPETQAMSDMQMNTEHIHAVVSDQNQNISEEHLENPTNRESEAEQLESTSPFVQIQESKSSQLDVTKETLEFNSSEKRRKIGSTRKSLRGQIHRGDQENKLEAIKDKENIQEQNMDQEGTNTGEIEEENDDTKEEINAGNTENFIKEDITTVSAEQNVLCELSSQTTDLGLSAIEHPSPATEHPDFKQDDGNITENVEKTNAEIHTQTQTKKKKKFGSTRRPHGRHQPHAEGEEGEWKDPENTEEIEHQIITQAATSNLLTEPQNTMSEVTLDIHDSPMTTEQKEIIKAEVEIVTEGIDASPAILSHEVDQIHTVVSDEVSNAEGLTDIIEQHERSGVNEENVAESTLLYEQEMEPVITKIQDDAFTEHVSLAVKKHGNGSPDNEHVASEVNVYNTCGPVELIPETQAMSDMQMNTEHIHAVISDRNQNISEEHLENPTNRESEAEQLESTSPFVQIQESKSSQLDVTKETLEFSSSEKRRKIGSTRKSLRGQIPRGDQENKLEAIKDKENIQEQNMDQEGTNTGEIEEENDDTKEEINAGTTENLIKEDITTVSAEQNVLCELSSQTTDLGLSALEHPSPATEHPDFKQDDGNITENVENRNAEIHTQTQTKKKKKFGSTRRPHGRHQPHAEGEEGEWKDPENTEEIEHQIITQAAPSNLLTEPQNTMSEVTLDIHDSPMTTEQKEIIKAEVEIVTEGIDASPAILSHEVDQIHTVVSDEVSNAEGLTDIIEQHERSGVNEENVAESTLLYEQEMEPVITKIQDDAFTEHVSLTVKKHGNGSPDNEHVASEVNVHNTCGPVELIPETQAMSDMQMNTEHIHAAVSDQNQNISEEHLENPTNRESEAEQLESTSPFVQIQESKSSQLDVTKETLEFSSSEKRRKIGSTRKSLRGQIPRGDQENKLEAIKDKENIQEQNMDQEGTNTGEIEEENDDAKEEINAGTTENLIKEDITTVSAEQNVLCELSSQTTDLGLSAIEHPSPATEHPDFKQDDGNITENVENRNAEIHTQTQTKKKKKFGSTRRPHGRHQPHAEGEEGEWKDPENTEEIEHQIITQAATSNLLTEPQNTMSEVTLDIHDSPMTTEQKEIIKAEVEIVTEGIDASPAILSHEVDQIHTVVSDEVSNAEGLTDIIEQHERSGVNEENVAESTLLYEQEMEPVITKIQDDAFTEHVSLAIKKHGNGSPDNEHVASEVNVYNTCGPVELIPETQAMSDMQMNTEHIHAVVSDQNQNISEEHLENPTNRESEAEQLESTSPFVQIQESKSSQLDVTKETLEFSSSEKRRKIGSTRKSLRGQIPRGDQENKLEAIKDKENIQEQNMDQEGTNTGEIEEENDDTKEEINAGTTENLIKEDITTVSAEQNVLCELSSQTTDLGLSALEHPSPATEHPDFKQDDGNITENVEKTNAEIHTQTQTKKKKKFGSTRRPHGRHQPHAEGEEGEWKDPETTEKIEHQIITQAATSNLLTEPQNTMSEVTLDIHDSPMTTEQKEIIKAEVEIVTEGIDASLAILSHEVDQIHTVVSDEVSNAEGLTDIIEQHERSGVNEKNDIESTLLYEQEMEPVITKIQDEAFTEHVSNLSQSMSQTKKKKKFGSTRRPHGRHQPHAEGEEGEWKDPENTEQTEHQIITQAATSNLLTEPQNTMSEVTLDIHDSPMTTEQKEIIKAEVEIVTEGIDASLAILSHEVDQIHTVVSDEVSNAEGLTDIIEQHERSGVNEENVAESTLLYEQEMEPVITKIQDDAFTEHVSNMSQNMSQTKKKKKFGSTRRFHGRHQPHAVGEEGEWKDVEDTEEIQIVGQAASSNLLTELQDAISELSLDILEPSLRNEQGIECTENESANQPAYPTHGPIELIPETHARLDMPVVSEQYHMMSEEHLENPKNRDSKPEQCESTCSVVHIQELKLAPDEMATQNSGHSGNSGRRKKIASTRRSLRVIKEKENIQEQTTEEITSTSEKDHAQERTFNLTTEISHQSIQTHSEPLNIIDPEAEKMSSTCKNLEEGQSKQEALQKTKDMNPRYAGDIDREHLKLVAIEDSVNPDSIFGDTKTRVPEYEPQIHNNLDQSEGSLLSEIEFYLNKSFECTLNTTALNPNISEFSEPMSEVSLQLPSSQNPQIHMEPSSPARRRKMGSSRKTSRNKHAEKISNESGGSEQEKENLDKNNAKNSEPKREAKTVKETVMAAGTEDMKESVELMSEVQALSRINESSTQDTGQLLPEGRRKFGSRRTAKGRSGLGAFTHDDYESNQKKTDDQVTKDDSRVSDPYFISEPETTPISHPVSEPRPEIEEVRKTVVKDTNASTKAGVVVNTGGRQKIDFDQWNEQLPDFGLAIYNVVMVGNSNVGKTSFIKRLQSGQFTPDYGATIGVDTFIQTVTFGSRTVKLYVWDTAGQERYHSITRQVFHKAQGLLLMYDITSSQSFHAVRAWISQVQEKAPSDVILMLLGNKNDCAHREVQLQEGEDLSKEYNIHFMECSAATGDNVSESLKTLAWLLVKQRVRKDEQHTTLQPKPQNKKSGCC